VALNQRQWLLIVLGVLIVVLGAFYLLGSKAAPPIPKDLSADCVCLSCKVESEVKYPREEAAPHRCPKCGTQAAYPVFYCFNCKHRFVPTLVRGDSSGPPRLPMTIACPKCGTQGAMAYIPNEPMFTPTGEILLPRWP
jgi:hypothetical protein